MERKVFAWVVRHLRWLARIPGSVHAFDAACFIWTMLFQPRRRVAMESLEEAILSKHPCALGTHHLGGSAYRLGSREFAHLHGIGLLDVRLSRERAEAFVTTTDAEPHHVLGRSAWVSLWIDSRDDLPLALKLIDAAVGEAGPFSVAGSAGLRSPVS